MEEKELNNLIVVEQLPKIKQTLQVISDSIDEKINYAMSLECTEESVKEVKNVRAELNKIKTALEDKRKQVKSAVLQPYEEFEDIYNKLVKNKLLVADASLKQEIDDIENEQKKQKETELRKFVEEHCKANNIHIDFEKIGLNITLSASMKSLKDQAKAFIEKVANDLKLIEMEEYSSEILYEYGKCMDYVLAKTTVLGRHKELEEIQKQQDSKNQIEQQEQEIVEKVDEAIEITAPTEIVEELDNTPSIYQFEVKATKEQIKKLIEFMKELGVEYK